MVLSLQQLGFSPWPGNFHMPEVQPKKQKKIFFFLLFTVVCLITQEGKYLFGKLLDSLATTGVIPMESGHYPFHDGENHLWSQVCPRPGEMLPYNLNLG